MAAAAAAAAAVANHEELFRCLCLWDFAHLDPTGDALRLDLLRPLITTYDPNLQCSLVKGSLIDVSRAALATALALPLVPPPTQRKHVLPLAKKRGAAKALENLILDHMVFMAPGSLLPDEVVLAIKRVKDRRPDGVDWTGLLWALLLRDLKEASRSGKCYYANHLQRLIKHQRPDLFQHTAPEIPVQETPVVTEAQDEDGDQTDWMVELGFAEQPLESTKIPIQETPVVAKIQEAGEKRTEELDDFDWMLKSGTVIDAMESIISTAEVPPEVPIQEIQEA